VGNELIRVDGQIDIRKDMNKVIGAFGDPGNALKIVSLKSLQLIQLLVYKMCRHCCVI